MKGMYLRQHDSFQLLNLKQELSKLRQPLLGKRRTLRYGVARSSNFAVSPPRNELLGVSSSITNLPIEYAGACGKFVCSKRDGRFSNFYKHTDVMRKAA